eukprot:CAMPEP_0185781444 /NCGR_PEP_ID=MMETSP1174-20130828/102473_1 /TAXON_ID=35687 /ORGANISM="Dictyocha speculum, Strain CCMP1381" /LENGTH=33 /DNA_ID= /DNA_START= /DNA_END= /DNA_ORIENTATION=
MGSADDHVETAFDMVDNPGGRAAVEVTVAELAE